MEAVAIQQPKIKLQKQSVVFDGGAGDFLITGILAFLVTAFTFGICYPWALVMKERWIIEHTIIDGNDSSSKARHSVFSVTGSSGFSYA